MTQPESPLDMAARNALTVCLGVSPQESVLVVTDEAIRPVGEALYRAARELAGEAVLVEMPVATASGAEPPAPVAAAMEAAAVSLCPTRRSLTHTDARRRACAAGGRVATLPGITEDCMVRCLSADYERIAEVTHLITGRLTSASRARIACPHGTDLRMGLEGIEAIASTGLIREPGQGGNLPSGEAFLRPREGTSEGVLFIDGSIADLGILESPIEVRISAGAAVGFEGGEDASRLQKALDAHGPEARTVAELGVGTNDRARITGLVLEDEKVAGTVHVAFGNNVGMGGQVSVPIHLDGVLRHPSLWLDDVLVVDRGKLVG